MVDELAGCPPAEMFAYSAERSGLWSATPVSVERKVDLGTDGGRIFREAWIAGVKKHYPYPGEPKAGYIAPWDETPQWERDSAAAVYDQVRSFLELTEGRAAKLSRGQKGRFVALCWVGQIFKHFPDPKPSYVADWPDLPDWQWETDADIFERIERDR